MNWEELSNFAEEVHNGEPINWDYWASLSNITPAQAARLAFHIDPIKWPGMDYKQGAIPKDLLENITKLEQWLRNWREEWNLNDLVIFFDEPEAIEICGKDFAPYGMVEQFKKIQPQVVAEHERMREQLREQELEDSIKRGRYTIELAALFISRNSRSNFEDMKNELKKSIENSELKFYDTDMDMHFKPTRVREFFGEVFWDDLNDWLEKEYPRLGRLFPAPDSFKESAQVMPKSEKPETREWKKIAREIGQEWMETERKEKRNPGVIDIAKYVEGELSNRNITGVRGRFLDWETIKREALTGITGRPPNGKRKIS